ncbi:MAG: DUF885 domain-containing protein [Clostridia bacterium]
MKRRFIKLIALALCLTMVLPMLMACAPKIAQTPTAEDVATTADKLVIGTDNVVLTAPKADLEYAVFGGEQAVSQYQSVTEGKVTFTNLTVDTDYTIKARVPASGKYLASEAVVVIAFKTARTAPDVATAKPEISNLAIADRSIKLTITNPEIEYALYNEQVAIAGFTKGENGIIVWSELTPSTTYVIHARFAQTADKTASADVIVMQVTTLATAPNRPPKLEEIASTSGNVMVDATSITYIVPHIMFEYAIYDASGVVADFNTATDGLMNWTKLTNGTKYTIYARTPGTRKLSPSNPVKVLEVTTSPSAVAPTASMVVTTQEKIVNVSTITFKVPNATLEYALYQGKLIITPFTVAKNGVIVWEDLSNNQEYTIYARYASSDVANGSATVFVITIQIKVKPAAPTPEQIKITDEDITATDTTMTLRAPHLRLEYGIYLNNVLIGSYISPVDGLVTFTGLTPNVTYTIKARIGAIGDNLAGYEADVGIYTTKIVLDAPTAEQAVIAPANISTGIVTLKIKATDVKLEYGVYKNGKLVEGFYEPDKNGEVIFTWLERSTAYELRVRTAMDANGNMPSVSVKVADFTTLATTELEKNFEAYLDNQFLYEMIGSTVNLHYTLKDPTAYKISHLPGYEKYNSLADLPPMMYSVDLTEIEGGEAELRAFIEEIRAYNYLQLNAEQILIQKILIKYLELNLTTTGLEYYSTYFDSIGGIQNNMPINFAEYKFYVEKDITDYLALLKDLPTFFQQCLDYEAVRVTKGLGLMDSTLKEAIGQCQDFIKDQKTNYLILTFETKLNDVAGLTAEAKANYVAQHLDVFANYVVPAYKLLISGLEVFKGKGVNDGGYCNLERGIDYYTYRVKYKTGIDTPIPELFDYMMADWESIRREWVNMSSLDPEGWAYYRAHNTDFGHMEPEAILAQLEQLAKRDFPDLPKNNYVVREVHPALEESLSPAFYMIPPIDDCFNNTIYINRGQVDDTSLFSTLAHEGFPGHLFQNVYFFNTNPHEMRSVLSFNGYAEGWAVYVELQSYDMFDFGEFDYVVSRMGQIMTLVNLSVFSIIDMGVNYYGWDLAKVSNFLATNGLNDSIAPQVFKSVVSSPATYLQYYLGYHEFYKMRKYAEKELGNLFVAKAFNTVLLDAGPSQFEFVWEAVYKYVLQTKGIGY